VTKKEMFDTILKLLGLLLSWPIISLVIIMLLRRQLPNLVSNLSERITKAPGGFEFATLQSKVDGIEKTLQRIEKRILFRPSPFLSEELRDRLSTLIERFHTYLTNVGFVISQSIPELDVDPKIEEEGWYSYYDSKANVIRMSKIASEDPDVLLRKYVHRALVSSASGNYDVAIPNCQVIESGLADYFVASFKDSALLYQKFARGLKKPYGRNLKNSGKIRSVSDPDTYDKISDMGESWSGVFWEIRSVVGRESADGLLFSTWTTVRGRLSAIDGVANKFAKNHLIASARSRGLVERVGQIEGILRERDLHF